MKRHSMSSVLAISAALATPAFAQDTAFTLPEIVVQGTSLTPVEQSRSGASVDVVEVAEAPQAGASDDSVLDGLVRLPGVNATSNGGLGAASSIQVRGLPSRYVGVRIDGIDVADPSGTQNQFNFGGLTAAGLGRVELLKGSQSAIYGSEAIAGVVSISSFKPTKLGFSGTAQAEAGSFGTQSGNVSIAHKSEQGYVALSFGRIQSEGISAQSFNTEKDGFNQTTINLSAEYALSDAITVGGAILRREGDVEIDRSAFANDATGQIFTEEMGARVYTTVRTGAITHTLSYSMYDIQRLDPLGFTTQFDGKRSTLAYLGSAELGANASLNFGLDQTEEEMTAGLTTGAEKNNSITAELLFSPSGQLDLSAALRYDDNDTFGGKATGRLTAVYRPRQDLAFRAAIGSGYRAPSLYERFSAFGDTALQPESSLSYELGVEKSYGDRGFVKATLFYTDISDLIDFDPASTACASGFGCYAQVAGTTTSKGIEFSGEYAMSDMFKVYGGYTFTDASTNGTRLTRTPKHDLVLGVSGDFSPRFSGYVDVRHVADIVPSAFAPAGNLVDDYTLVGAGLSFDVTDSAELYLRVENLFDEKYETAGGFNQPGRAFFAGLRADF